MTLFGSSQTGSHIATKTPEPPQSKWQKWYKVIRTWINGAPLSKVLHYPEPTYTKKALVLVHICSSSIPTEYVFSSLWIKNESLCPCIVSFLEQNSTVCSALLLKLWQQASVFTRLDLHSTNSLNTVRQMDILRTFFITPMGPYEYSVMLFRLINASTIF